jgi:competence protein ComEC
MALWQPPDLLVSGDGRTLAVRTADGGLQISARNGRDFLVETWERRAGLNFATAWPRAGVSTDRALRCDPLGCRYVARERTVSIVRDPVALSEDCTDSDLVVATELTQVSCGGRPAIIDRRTLMSRGSHAVWLERRRVRILSDREFRGTRPWVSYPWQERPPSRRRRGRQVTE